MVDSTNAAKWFTPAQHDLKSGTYNLENEPEELADVVCFECHQACEKALKGFLLSKGAPIVRPHDLVQLLELASLHATLLKAFRASVTKLNEYSRDARHPADPPADFTSDEAQAAHIAATTLVDVLIELSGTTVPRVPTS